MLPTCSVTTPETPRKPELDVIQPSNRRIGLGPERDEHLGGKDRVDAGANGVLGEEGESTAVSLRTASSSSRVSRTHHRAVAEARKEPLELPDHRAPSSPPDGGDVASERQARAGSIRRYRMRCMEGS